ncbi:MAG TPA: hypothetical protein DCW90_09740 [Lachnospiraceae bacterium]|nr:hypothetical protein [Lachnospiraceae bacterium]
MAHLTKKDYKFFDMARKVAQESDFKNFHLGAVLVYKGRVISTGYNTNRTHPKQKKYNKYRHFNSSNKPVKNSLHAEMACIVNIPKCVENNIDFTQCKLYIYRISPGKHLQVGLSRPCPACRQAILDKGIRHLYYTGDGSFIHEELF